MDEDSSDVNTELRPADAVFTLGPDNEPIPIYLHDSLGRGGKEAIARKIREGGGHLTAEEDDAEVIICREDRPAFRQLEHKYDHFRYVWVEPPSWVDICLTKRRYVHKRPGRIAIERGGRVEFTADDDRHLARFLALRIPFKEVGGRAGNGVYKDLVAPERAHLYPWAKRHPWSSWRERYIKNQESFDRIIDRIVNRDPNPPRPGDKGQYHIPRKRKPKKDLRSTVEYDEESISSEDLEEDDEFQEEGDMEVNKRVPHKRPSPRHNPRYRRDVVRPQKKTRTYERFEAEESEEEIGSEIDREGKDKGRPVSRLDLVLSDRDFNIVDQSALDHPGPSQIDSIHIATTSSPQRASANIEHRSPFSNPAFSNPLGSPSRMTSSPRNFEKEKEDQAVVAEESSKTMNPHIAPPDTQATLVHKSQPRPRPPRSTRLRAPDTYPNTRSHPRPVSEHAPVVSREFPPPKRGRGRPRKDGSIRPLSLNTGGAVSHDITSSSLNRVASAADEARVEALLHDESIAEGGGDSNPSSDDQAAEKELLAGQRRLMTATPTRRGAGNSRFSGVRPAKEPPHVDLNIRTRAASRTPAIIRPSTLKTGNSGPSENAQEIDRSLTRPSKAAKKTANRGVLPPFEVSENSEESSETTGTSFPAEPTEAWEFKTAKSPFKPAPGTKAEQFTGNTKKGKGRREREI